MFKDFRNIFSKVPQKNFEQSPVQNNFDNPAVESNSEMISKSDKRSKTSIIVVVNQKGGCGKTTTAINLSAALADKNFRVLLIDLDAQAHASLGLGIDGEKLPYSIYDVIVKNFSLGQIVTASSVHNLEVAPATSLLSGAQLEIADLLGRELILRTAIYKMLNTDQRRYDYVIIDCSPSLNLLTINGMAAARHLLVPIQTHYFSLEGMKELFSTIEVTKERLNSELEILGILPTLFDSRTRMNKEILTQIRNYFKEAVFKTTIRMNIKLAEAQLNKKSIFTYAPSSNGAIDYLSLAEEVIKATRTEMESEIEAGEKGNFQFRQA